VHDQSANVADTFSKTSNTDSEGEPLQTSFNSKEKLSEKENSKHDTEEDVSS
jgi:hypothetical protein